MRTPPLNALRAFEAAARHSSFTLAAKELHVSAGAISRQVKILEFTASDQVQVSRLQDAFMVDTDSRFAAAISMYTNLEYLLLRSESFTKNKIVYTDNYYEKKLWPNPD
jgi:hypothetical protein